VLSSRQHRYDTTDAALLLLVLVMLEVTASTHCTLLS